jgi:hypothetical protein
LQVPHRFPISFLFPSCCLLVKCAFIFWGAPWADT